MKEKSSYLLIEKLLGFSTITGWILIFAFCTGIVCIVILGLNHISPTPVGDEYFYIQSAQNIAKNGLFFELAHGNPVGYTLIVLLISRLGISILLTARMLSLAAVIAVFIGLWLIGGKYFKLKTPYLILAILTCLLGIVTSGNFFFVAADDMYFMAFFIWLSVYLAEIAEKWANWRKFALAGVFFSLLLLIRPLTLLYFPAAIVGMAAVAFMGKNYFSVKLAAILAFILAFVCGFFLEQSHELYIKGAFAFENKTPDSVHTRANWVQKLDLTNIKKEKGEKLEDGKAASWRQCDEYLLKYGPHSLPANEIQRVLQHPVYFIKYYGIGAAKLVFILLRHTGLVFLLPLFFMFSPSATGYKKFAFFEVLCLSFLCMYLLHFLEYIETRHLIVAMAFMVFSGVYILQNRQEEGQKYATVILLVQILALIIILLLDLNFYFSNTSNWIFYG